MIAATANTPPIQPPTMAPIGVLDPFLEVGTGDGDGDWVVGFDDGDLLELGPFRLELEGCKEVDFVCA